MPETAIKMGDTVNFMFITYQMDLQVALKYSFERAMTDREAIKTSLKKYLPF